MERITGRDGVEGDDDNVVVKQLGGHLQEGVVCEVAHPGHLLAPLVGVVVELDGGKIARSYSTLDINNHRLP